MAWDNGLGIYLFDFSSGQATALNEGPGLYYENFVYWAWSPDGKQLAYQACADYPAGPTNLWILELTSGEKRLLRETSPGCHPDQHLSWHRNGQVLLIGNEFISATDGRLVASLSTEHARRHTFSPDGTRLAIIDAETDIGSLISIYDVAFDNMNSAGKVNHQVSCAYLDNGIKREFGCTKNIPAIFTADDKKRFEMWGQIFEVAWSPRGDLIALQVETNSLETVRELYLIKPDGTGLKNLTRISELQPGWYLSGSPFQQNFSWSPDGSKIAFAAGCPDCPARIFIAEVDTGDILELTGGEIACRSLPCSPLWTPDGQWVAFQGDLDGVFGFWFVLTDRSQWLGVPGDILIGAGPRDFRPILSTTAIPSVLPTQMPLAISTTTPTLSAREYFNQGSKNWRVAYEDYDNNQICASFGDGTGQLCAPLTLSEIYGWFGGSWSPDGGRLLFKDGGSLHIWDLDRGITPYQVVSGIVYESPDWSPDGKYVAYETTELQRGVGQIYGMDIFVSSLDKAEKRNITRYLPAKSHSRNPDWSPDGSMIAFDSMIHDWDNPSDTEIYIVAPDGSTPRALTANLSDDMSPVWSPGSALIAFLSNREGAFDLYVMNADGTNPKRAARLGLELADAHNAGDYYWLPDEKHILFEDKLIELVTGNITRLQFGFSASDAAWLIRPAFDTLIPIPTPHCAAGWTRLTLGMLTTVSQGDPNRVRSGPGKANKIIGQLYPGTVSKVVEGPVCTDGLVFWRVENATIPGGSGWTAEGDGKEYWLEPLK
jgi:Tol biopolymer transport system component